MPETLLAQLLDAVAGARLLEDAAGDVGVRRVVCDSRQVRPGDLFVAVPGTSVDGHDFLEQAVRQGAAAVMVERPGAAPEGVPTVVVADARLAVALVAHRLAGDPSRALTVCGVTGTNGKTTTTFLLRSILAAAGQRAGLLGTISYQIGDRDVPAPTTTPGPVELAGYLADLVAQGYDAAVMEVSSHALDQWRTAGVHFRVAGFTNLSPEHQDYHKDMASYRQAKGRLFAELEPRAVAVLNRDDETSAAFAEATPAERVIWYSIHGPADVCATDIDLATDCTTFTLHVGRWFAPVRLRLLGRFNVSNALAAAAMATGLGIDPQTIVRGLEKLRAVPGRLEPVDCGQPFAVLVDYAHTDDALENSLSSVRALVESGRVIVVFGCGGDRDRSKRPRMAAVAERLADVVIVTSDNPRTEPAEAILDEVMAGFAEPCRVRRITDRAEAIRAAVADADAGDVVLVAGKGHETYQVIGTTRHDFDDRAVAQAALAELGFNTDARCD